MPAQIIGGTTRTTQTGGNRFFEALGAGLQAGAKSFTEQQKLKAARDQIASTNLLAQTRLARLLRGDKIKTDLTASQTAGGFETDRIIALGEPLDAKGLGAFLSAYQQSGRSGSGFKAATEAGLIEDPKSTLSQVFDRKELAKINKLPPELQGSAVDSAFAKKKELSSVKQNGLFITSDGAGGFTLVQGPDAGSVASKARTDKDIGTAQQIASVQQTINNLNSVIAQDPTGTGFAGSAKRFASNFISQTKNLLSASNIDISEVSDDPAVQAFLSGESVAGNSNAIESLVDALTISLAVLDSSKGRLSSTILKNTRKRIKGTKGPERLKSALKVISSSLKEKSRLLRRSTPGVDQFVPESLFGNQQGVTTPASPSGFIFTTNPDGSVTATRGNQ